MTNSAAEKRVQGEFNMNTAVLPALAIPSNQNHQPVKTSLQKRFFRGLGLVTALALCTPAFAVLTMDYVSVGHAGNAADTALNSPYGAVAYAYQIGKYEVTNAQYTEFLNAVNPTGTGTGGIGTNGVYNVKMGSDVRGGITFTSGSGDGLKYTIRSNMGDKPVNFVSWYDGARFTNWMHNGQGSGSTETGAYTLSANTGIITKNVGATVYLPSEDEWYKAAYYDPTTGAGGGDNYWAYATQSDTAPTEATANGTGVISNPGANVANYNNGAGWNSQNGNVTTVGSAGAAANSYFGTADQAGNVREWNDAVINITSRGLRGGSWGSDSNSLAASNRLNLTPANESGAVGFRVASVPVPEPSAFLVSMLLVSAFLTRRRRTTL
jgi:formylglycine-generating enzyme required for sulfatase activity